MLAFREALRKTHIPDDAGKVLLERLRIIKTEPITSKSQKLLPLWLQWERPSEPRGVSRAAAVLCKDCAGSVIGRRAKARRANQ